MQKILISLFILFFVNIATSQNYRPKSFVEKLGNSSMPLKLKWAIKLDSNYSVPYYQLAKYNQKKRNYLTNKGSIYYYHKFFEVNKRFLTNRFDSKYELIKPAEERLTAITSAFRQNPDFFKKDNKLSDFTQSELLKIVEDCVNDIENYGLNDGFGNLSKEIFEAYMLKAQLDFDKNDIDAYLTTCKVILSKTENFEDFFSNSKEKRLQVYNDMINKFFEIGDTLSASQALNENLKIYKEEEKNNLEYRNKQKQLISLLNHLNNISNDKYDICSSNGTDVFCRNKNVRIANYSSALKFWNVYFQENSIFFDMLIKNNEYFKNVYFNYGQRYFGFKYEYLAQLYDFYLKKGKESGMIWPQFGGFQQLSSKHFDDSYGILYDIVKTELNTLKNVYDLLILESIPLFTSIAENPDEITISNDDEILSSQRKGKCRYQFIGGAQTRLSDSVYVFDITINYPKTWENLLNIPVIRLDGDKKQYFKNSKGEVSTNSTQFKKLYELEKQKYENEQALIRARQLQQQEELRRLEQERLNRETQTRLIEEENERKQKEIDLVNAENKQLENKRALENKKAEKIFWDKVFNSPSPSTNSKTISKTCEWCSQKYSGTGYYYEKRYSGDCNIRDFIVSNWSANPVKYCSRKCALEACEHKSR